MEAARSPQQQKLSFDNGGAFVRDTRRDVEAYLADGRAHAAARRLLHTKAIVAVALTACCWAALMFGSPGLPLGLACFAGLVTGTALVAFCIMHDANHGAYFRTRRLNHLLGWTADVALGISSYAWRVKHNVAHHTYTNVDGYDDDVAQTPFARLLPPADTLPLTVEQAA